MTRPLSAGQKKPLIFKGFFFGSSFLVGTD